VGGAHTRAPWTLWHADPAAQQSPSNVQVSPSAEQVEVHDSVPVDPGSQWPPQHSAGVAQLAPSARQAPSPGASHLWTPGGGGGGGHVSPGQQSGLPPHVSPSAPQVGAGWHTPNPSSSALHEPEQQSAPDEHSSHSARQPPDGVHRFAPSPCVVH
jgi:hypothetical protein